MKRAWLSIVAVAVLGALPLSCSSEETAPAPKEQSAPEALCTKLKECMLLFDMETLSQCVYDKKGVIDQLRTFPACMPLADAEEQDLACLSKLSCDALKTYYESQMDTQMCDAFNAVPADMTAACMSAMMSSG